MAKKGHFWTKKTKTSQNWWGFNPSDIGTKNSPGTLYPPKKTEIKNSTGCPRYGQKCVIFLGPKKRPTGQKGLFSMEQDQKSKISQNWWGFNPW